MSARRLVVWVAAVLVVAAGCAATQRHAHGAYSFVTLGDNRSGEPVVQPQAYRDNIRLINALAPQPDFVVIVGDLILGYTDDRELILREWEEFDRVTSALRPRVYLVPGNHDIWSEESRRIYMERHGPTYYSFDHKGDHFIVLSSEEQGEGEAGRIVGVQLDWLAADLERHGGARHTFVFLHQPLWAAPRGMAESGWDETVHPLLAKHGVDVVFAGHDHQFVNYGVRDGVQYYVTGGAGAPAGGLGGFHHFMVTTVEPAAARSVVVDVQGAVLPDDVVTVDMKAGYAQLSEALTFPGFELPAEADRVVLSRTLHNPFDKALQVRYAWGVAGTGWEVEPADGAINVAPQGEAVLEAVARFDRKHLVPVPEFRSTLLVEGRRIADISCRLQPLIRRQAAVAQVERSPVIDGVVGEAEYGAAQWNGAFVDYRGRGNAEHETKFLLAYDHRALYIAVVGDEPDPGAITLQPRERDGEIWRDDDIEVFVDADFDRSTYHQFAVNLGGVQFDAIGGPEHGQWGDTKWDARWESRVSIGATQYVVEFVIPYEALGVGAPKAGDTWGLNICRQRQALSATRAYPEMDAWSIPYANFHVPTHFGTVTFR